MFSRKLAFARAPSAITQYDFIDEISPHEDRIHNSLEIVRGRGGAVQVDGSGRFEHAAHFEQPNCHEAHIGAHAVGVGVAGALDGRHELGEVIGNLIHPRLVEIAALVERRIGGDQVHRLRVHGPKELQVVTVEQRAV